MNRKSLLAPAYLNRRLGAFAAAVAENSVEVQRIQVAHVVSASIAVYGSFLPAQIAIEDVLSRELTMHLQRKAAQPSSQGPFCCPPFCMLCHLSIIQRARPRFWHLPLHPSDLSNLGLTSKFEREQRLLEVEENCTPLLVQDLPTVGTKPSRYN